MGFVALMGPQASCRTGASAGVAGRGPRTVEIYPWTAPPGFNPMPRQCGASEESESDE